MLGQRRGSVLFLIGCWQPRENEMPCGTEMQYLLTLQVSKYCLCTGENVGIVNLPAYIPVYRQVCGRVTDHWSDTPLVRHTIGPTQQWSDTPLVRQTLRDHKYQNLTSMTLNYFYKHSSNGGRYSGRY